MAAASTAHTSRSGTRERGTGEAAKNGTFLRLGGLDQWVMIRGANRDNPVLVTLHGGPGFSDTTFLRCYNAVLEEHFTVVYWDQRGTGKSYRADIPRASMNVEQFISDLDELVEHVRAHTGMNKVTLFGHSWGTVLGVMYAQRFPEKVAAYVGAAQIGDWPHGEELSYRYALAEAERQNKKKILAKLRALGPPPHAANAVLTERTLVQRLDGQLRAKPMWKVLRMVLGARESSVFELPRTLRGFRFTMEAMWPEVSRLNMIERVPELGMPMVTFVGRRDHWVLPESSVSYFAALRAPYKKLVWFDESAHEAFVDEPDKFNDTMIELVLPLARGETQIPPPLS